jgi:hypothetical protein
VTSEARRTLALIRECIEEERFALTEHFYQRMENRGLFWPDVQAVIDSPSDVRSQGMDDHNRPKWIIAGQAALGGEIEIVCAIETRKVGGKNSSDTEFITIYWED